MKSREFWVDWIKGEMTRSAELKIRSAESIAEQILDAAESLIECFRSNGKVLICGNGGSAADAQHMAAEFVNRLSADLDRPGLPAIALTTDTSLITAYANDLGFDGIFERQVLTLGRAGDALIAISTSGQSRNVSKAVVAARTQGLRTIGLVGAGGHLTDLVDHALVIPSHNTQYIQECFLSIEHNICGIVEQSLFGEKP
jgi:D-sedoheptulose 7-phosphate isomerase